MPIRWAVRSARDTRAVATAILLAAAWASSIPLARAQAQNQACTPVMARVVSLQGSVELRSAAKAQWERVKHLDTLLCQGDRLRTGPNSRAALFIPPENLLRVDQNTTVSVHVEQDETIVEFFIDETSRRNACGAGYAISRFPRKFKINTPFSYAAVEGTEFLVAMTCSSATVSVFEGKVAVEQRIAQASRVLLESGQTATVGPDQPPAVQVLVKPIDAVQWALYYPPLADPQFQADPLHAPCESLAGDKRPACLLERAEALVRAGQVNEAQVDIRDLLALEPNNGDAFALRAVINVARNEKADALRFAQQATTLSPKAYRPWLALSYAQQAEFKLEQALDSARKAAALAPTSALPQARVAELLMSLGRIREADKVARQAVAVDPKQSRGHVILGFVQLAQIDIQAARHSFNQAIELDSTDPLPRLGLGLAIIREGTLEEGRQQIEIAVALDPTNSLLRSYLGKAYYEENTAKRDQLAASQYALAKELDPKDPTPWFYDAILKQTQNRKVEALEELQKSIDLNDNRAVYRSRFLLDEDAAARRVDLAGVYRDLGFDQLALSEGFISLNTDPGSSAAHRFRADTYVDDPRADVARLSEMLQAQLREPLNLYPIQPRLSADRNFFLRSVGPSVSSINEFNALFNRNELALNAEFLGATNSTFGDQIMLSGIYDRAAFALAQFHFQTDGFRDNNDFQQDIYEAFVQVQPSANLSLQAQVRSNDTESGDLPLRFDPQNFRDVRENVSTRDFRLGGRLGFEDGSDLIGSLRFDQSTTDFVIPDVVSFTTDSDAYVGELQYLRRFRSGNAIVGGGYYSVNSSVTLDSVLIDEPTGFHFNAYGYLNIAIPRTGLQVLPAVSYDQGEYSGVQFDDVNPKLGLVWQPQPTTTVRAVYASVVKRAFVAGQTLEPTQLAGFQQFFDDPDGTTSELRGVGVDQKLQSRVFAGVQIAGRDLQLPPLVGVPDFPFRDWHERTGRAYLSWIVNRRLTLSAQLLYENFQRPAENAGNEDFVNVETYRAPLGVALDLGQGWNVTASASYVDQSGTFFDHTGSLFDGQSRFWVFDAGVAFRFPARRGFIAFEVRNLFDQSFQFQETSNSPRIAPSCYVAARVGLSF